MGRITLTEGFLPPLPGSMTLRRGRAGTHIIQAHGGDARGVTKDFANIVDRYSTERLPKIRNGSRWLPIYTGFPSFRAVRLTFTGASGSVGVGLRRLTFSSKTFFGGGAFGSTGYPIGDPADTPGYSVAGALSEPFGDMLGWRSTARGAGPYTIGYTFRFPKYTPWYRLEPLSEAEGPGLSWPQVWTLEVYLPGWGWVVTDDVDLQGGGLTSERRRLN